MHDNSQPVANKKSKKGLSLLALVVGLLGYAGSCAYIAYMVIFEKASVCLKGTEFDSYPGKDGCVAIIMQHKILEVLIFLVCASFIVAGWWLWISVRKKRNNDFKVLKRHILIMAVSGVLFLLNLSAWIFLHDKVTRDNFGPRDGLGDWCVKLHPP